MSLSFRDYLDSELRMSLQAPKRDALFGETRRDKLYNSLFWVGPHLERFMLFGALVCLDCFLVRTHFVRLCMHKPLMQVCPHLMRVLSSNCECATGRATSASV